MDDFVGGANSIAEAKQLYEDITSSLASIGKWASSSNSVMQEIPVELRENKEITFYESDQTVKTLGLLWSPETDTFKYKFANHATSPSSPCMPQASEHEINAAQSKFKNSKIFPCRISLSS